MIVDQKNTESSAIDGIIESRASGHCTSYPATELLRIARWAFSFICTKSSIAYWQSFYWSDCNYIFASGTSYCPQAKGGQVALSNPGRAVTQPAGETSVVNSVAFAKGTAYLTNGNNGWRISAQAKRRLTERVPWGSKARFSLSECHQKIAMWLINLAILKGAFRKFVNIFSVIEYRISPKILCQMVQNWFVLSIIICARFNAIWNPA